MAKPRSLKGKDLLRQIRKQKTLAPVYYLYGDDPYQLQELITEITARLQIALKDFNFHQLAGGDISGDKIASLAKQLPMMDDYCIILVREAQQIKKGDWELLLPYLKEPSPTTCLTFVDPSSKPGFDARTKLGKIIKPYLVGCVKPYDNQMPRWLQDRAKHYKVNMGQAALYRLLELQGNDLPGLNNALERLSLYIGGKGEVSIDLVNEVIANNRSFNVFDLSGLVGSKNLSGALRTLRGLLEGGEAPLKLLSLLARAFRDLLKARVDFELGLSGQAIGEKYISKRIPPFFRDEKVRQLLRQVKSFSLPELRRAIFLMHQTDLSLKSTSGLTPELLMERLILELCQK